MLTKLTLERFKNFKKAELVLGPVTSLVGTNASGKSNIRDAFRLLHGIGRGYTLAEIIGEKRGEGGELQWSGIRGGTRESTYLQADTFMLAVELIYKDERNSIPITYSIEIKPEDGNGGPRVVKESLYADENMIFDSYPPENPPEQKTPQHILARTPQYWGHSESSIKEFSAYQPVLTQFHEQLPKQIEKQFTEQPEPKVVRDHGIVLVTITALASMRFFVLNPSAMHHPSFPGQIVLGDQGENLSSVLQAICEDHQKKKALLKWIRELTPMDVSDFEFVSDQTGKILLTLVEENGSRISAYSSSDGTLRFLTIIAALLGPKPAKFLFFEELENGLHPSRLHLLLQLMERKASEGRIQIVNTTHSPQFLRFLSTNAVQHASLTYRLPGTSEGRIEQILDIPDAQRLIEEQDIANLHESGWFEDALFLDEAEVVE
ncbi:MAG: ATP-binding protein [bacterium]|nr:ATP-binding protein [bacterium]